MEKQPFEFVGTTVYQLEFDSWRKGEAQMRNRVYANVQGYRDTPKEELEATARLFAAAPDLLEALKICLPLAERLAMNFGSDPTKDQDFIKAWKAIAKAQGEAE